MSVDGLKRLKVWVRAKDFALEIYEQVLPLFPLEEKWNLGSQLRRSSLSISANIAEGYGRFCYLARGSLEETLSHLVFAVEAKYISEDVYKQLESEGEEIDKMLNGYISYLKKSKQGADEPGANRVISDSVSTYVAESFEASADSEDTVL